MQVEGDFQKWKCRIGAKHINTAICVATQIYTFIVICKQTGAETTMAQCQTCSHFIPCAPAAPIDVKIETVNTKPNFDCKNQKLRKVYLTACHCEREIHFCTVYLKKLVDCNCGPQCTYKT